jgi:hypothetical protein
VEEVMQQIIAGSKKAQKSHAVPAIKSEVNALFCFVVPSVFQSAKRVLECQVANF